MPTYKGQPFTPQVVKRTPIPKPLLEGYGQQPAIIGFTDRKEVQAPTLAPQGKVVPPPTAPPGGAAKPAPTYKPQAKPFDAQSLEEKANAAYRARTTGIDILQDANRVKSSYGFDDASDPFSKARMLVRNYQQGQRGTTNAMAARGQLYAGSTNNALGEGTFQYNKSYAGLRREYEDQRSNLAKRAQANTRYQYEVNTAADRGALERATAAGSTAPVEPNAPGPLTAAAAANPKVKSSLDRLVAIQKALKSHPGNWSQAKRLRDEGWRIAGTLAKSGQLPKAMGGTYGPGPPPKPKAVSGKPQKTTHSKKKAKPKKGKR